MAVPGDRIAAYDRGWDDAGETPRTERFIEDWPQSLRIAYLEGWVDRAAGLDYLPT